MQRGRVTRGLSCTFTKSQRHQTTRGPGCTRRWRAAPYHQWASPGPRATWRRRQRHFPNDGGPAVSVMARLLDAKPKRRGVLIALPLLLLCGVLLLIVLRPPATVVLQNTQVHSAVLTSSSLTQGLGARGTSAAAAACPPPQTCPDAAGQCPEPLPCNCSQLQGTEEQHSAGAGSKEGMGQVRHRALSPLLERATRFSWDCLSPCCVSQACTYYTSQA
jgi:hypothetical protein